MAAGALSEPGSKYGSCEGDCLHTDCAQIKCMAQELCSLCDKEIGYDTRFYCDGAKELPYTHALCLEKEIETGKMAAQG